MGWPKRKKKNDNGNGERGKKENTQQKTSICVNGNARDIYISSAAEYTEKNTNDFIVRFCVNYTIRTIIHPGRTPFFLSFGSFLFKSFWRQERRFLRSRIRRRRSSSTSTAPAAPHEYKHITLWSIYVLSISTTSTAESTSCGCL